MQRLLRVALAAALGMAAAGSFAAQRTFVAPDGSDANVCSITLPCRSFGPESEKANAGSAARLRKHERVLRAVQVLLQPASR